MTQAFRTSKPKPKPTPSPEPNPSPNPNLEPREKGPILSELQMRNTPEYRREA